MIDLKLAVNDKIEVISDNKEYKSNVQDINEEYISISVPVSEGKYAVLNKEDIISVIYVNKNNTYKFESKIIGRKVEKIPIILISLPKKIVKIQRREFVRIPLIQDINYKCFKDVVPDKKTIKAIVENNLLKGEGHLVDLSGNGMKIKISDDVSIGDVIISKISLKDEDIIVKGKIVRIQKDYDNRNVCGIKFINMLDSDSEKIISYVFEIMRKQLARRS